MVLMFRYWYKFGIKMGYISPVFCVTHDGGTEYMSEEALEEWEEGGDPCQFVFASLLDS
jgi:hypothetical protein